MKINTEIRQTIIDALDNFANGIKPPKTKTLTKEVSIFDIKPIDLIDFMKNNNIPDGAEFDGVDNGYDGYEDFVLSWDIQVPTTEPDNYKYTTKQFNNLSFRHVYNALKELGIDRRRLSPKLSEIDKFGSLYELYRNKNYDRLIEYYHLYFEF